MADSVVAIIPARAGSKSVPDKNIKPLGNHPLIAYSIVIALKTEGVGRVIVSTDSEVYADIARSYGAEVPFIRPEAISGDDATDYEWIQHALDWLKEHEGEIPDLFVHLRPTTPLRKKEVVANAIRYMQKHPDATSLRSAHRTHLTPYKMFRLEEGYMRPFLHYEGHAEFYNLPRQVFEDAYIPNGHVDVLRPSLFLDTGSLHGDRMKLWETQEVPDIDTLADYQFACRLLEEGGFHDLQELAGIKSPIVSVSNTHHKSIKTRSL